MNGKQKGILQLAGLEEGGQEKDYWTGRVDRGEIGKKSSLATKEGEFKKEKKFQSPTVSESPLGED